MLGYTATAKFRRKIVSGAIVDKNQPTPDEIELVDAEVLQSDDYALLSNGSFLDPSNFMSRSVAGMSDSLRGAVASVAEGAAKSQSEGHKTSQAAIEALAQIAAGTDDPDVKKHAADRIVDVDKNDAKKNFWNNISWQQIGGSALAAFTVVALVLGGAKLGGSDSAKS